MAVPGPADRTFAVDNQSDAAQNVTSLLVGTPSGCGEIEEVLHDLTGPGATSAVILPVGFAGVADMVLTLKADVGGAIDPTAIFYAVRTGSRTVTITFVTGWTFASESYIFSSKPKPDTRLLSLFEVGFRFTGAVTAT